MIGSAAVDGVPDAVRALASGLTNERGLNDDDFETVLAIYRIPVLYCSHSQAHVSKPGQMKTLPPRITMHLRPVVRRLTVSWIAAVVIVAAMAVGMAYHARQVVAVGWLAVAALSVYALALLRRLRP